MSCWLCAFVAPASADEHAPRLVVLHRDSRELPATELDQVDRLLLSSVAKQVQFASAYASQVPLDEVELAAGCSTRDADCTQRIADSLGADWLLVRELSRDRVGHVFLTLIAHDGPGALVTRRVVSQIGGPKASERKTTPAEVVPLLVERLYPRAPLAQNERGPRQGWSAANVVGWSLAGVGTTLLVAGVATGAMSRNDHQAYQHANIGSQRDVDHAENLLARSQQRARIANGLLIGGASAGLAGAATLLWTYLRPSTEVRNMRLAVAPARSGLSFSVAGSWRGGL